jgi:type II secretory pathway pseudopilin PulG
MSMAELAVVCGIMAVMAVIAIPQLVGARRNIRAAAIPTEIKAQLRFARQTAMGRRRAVTFQYRTDTHEISIIQHNFAYPVAGGGTTNVGTAVLNDPAYPLTASREVVRVFPLAPANPAGGPSPHIAYGLPPNTSNLPLDDTTTLSAPVNGRVNITFQPDGSVIDAAGATANFALMFYHPDHPEATLRAVSVLGASGRVKTWRYTDDHTFVE